MFTDPAGQYAFSLPAGWAYDPNASHLSTVIFRRWDRAEETVSVRAVPSCVRAEASVEQWHAAVEQRYFWPGMRPVSRQPFLRLQGVAGEEHVAQPVPTHRRLIAMRGLRLDILAGHAVPEPSGGPIVSDVLATVSATLDVPTNRFLPAPVAQDAVVAALAEARQALANTTRNPWVAAAPAVRAQEGAQAMYLFSLLNRHPPVPELPAVASLVEALLIRGFVTDRLPWLRDAEHLALRARRTIRALAPAPLGTDQVDGQLRSLLDALVTAQLAMLGYTTPPDPPPSPGAPLCLARVAALTREAQHYADMHWPDLGLWFAETAVADQLTVLSQVGHVERRALLPSLVEQLGRVLALRHAAGDVTGVVDASRLRLDVARALHRVDATTASPALRLAEDERAPLAEALIDYAAAMTPIGDAPSLGDADRALTEAEHVLDERGEDGALRALWCVQRALVLHAQKRADGALDVIDRGFHAAAADGTTPRRIIAKLHALQSQFLLVDGRLPEARTAALAALDEGGASTPVAEVAERYLNLANVERARGDAEGALHGLRQALALAMPQAPFGELVSRILELASMLLRQHEPELASLLNVAAAACLDARRARITPDALRVGFDESERRRQVYADLVTMLVAANAGVQALTMADRSRARSLNALLSGPARESSTTTPASVPELPPLTEGEPRRGLREAARYVISHADTLLREDGGVAPLDGDGVQHLAGLLGGAQSLVVQPLHERVMLFVLQPTGDVEMRVSPMTRDDLLTALDTVREQLRIRSVSRGSAPGPAGSSAGLDALARLGEGLIAPVGDLLVADQPLVVVPYREFTLVPFALLPDRDGVPLVEHHALQVVPSLATLWWLRQRGPWQRRCPRRAYIAGDPDLAMEARIAGLEPLPAARAEARRLADLLVTAGVPQADVVVRQGSDAHVESYRREALGCDLLHLACHGALEVPADTSRLYLAPHGPYGSVLLSREIVDVRLNDALVYLSACDTGQGRATADGVIGFGRSFLAAGARAVVVSLWAVDDAAAAALADHVYQHLLADDHPTLADALRTAMVATRADLAAGRITTAAGEVLACEAAYWAPFVVLGDGLAVRYA